MPDVAPGRELPNWTGTPGHLALWLASGLWLAVLLPDAQAEIALPGIGVRTDPATIVRLPLKERENIWFDKAAVRSGPISSRAVEEAYRAYGIDLAEVMAAQQLEIPRLAFAMVPGDLVDAMTAARRKRIFVGLLLPAVLAVNEALLAERTRLEAFAWQQHISEREARWLEGLASSYGCEPNPLCLLDRVDVIPTPIALAQAALESGWGRSRFARSGNALFGKRTSVAHRGIRPLASSEPIYIERFSHLIDAVASYAFILNSGAKFGGFRKRRAEMRLAGAPLDSLDLVSTLTGYSERGTAYVKDLEAMTAALSGLARARFESPANEARPGIRPASSLAAIDDIAASPLLPSILTPVFPTTVPIGATVAQPRRGHGSARGDLPIAMVSGGDYQP